MALPCSGGRGLGPPRAGHGGGTGGAGAAGRLLARGTLGAGGALDQPVARGEVPIGAGPHEARFAVGDWLRAADPKLGRVFIEVAVMRFEVLDPAEHVHLPLKFTRWGLALFRGS